MSQNLDPSVVHGALSGLRVVDLTGDAGRFATKLLSELGADVVRVGAGSPGLPLADPAAAALGGVADWWYDGGKRRCPVDLGTVRVETPTAGWPRRPTSSWRPSVQDGWPN